MCSYSVSCKVMRARSPSSEHVAKKLQGACPRLLICKRIVFGVAASGADFSGYGMCVNVLGGGHIGKQDGVAAILIVQPGDRVGVVYL